MEINVEERHLKTSPASWELVKQLRENEIAWELENSQLYYDFPILKDTDDEVIIAQLVLISQNHGVVAFRSTDITSYADANSEIQIADKALDHIFSLIYSRLIRNKSLRKSKTTLICPANAVIYAPNLDEDIDIESEAQVIRTTIQLEMFFKNIKTDDFSQNGFEELVSTFEGAKGLIRVRPRDVTNLSPTSKGAIANRIESEVTSFDKRQKVGSQSVLDGLQRIRGLAGSGKTVVLAMKAALTHLRNPDALIAYTFYTKSLYQHIQRLITRFYRQFDDRDPDWTRLKIIHGWGGFTSDGIYFNTCVANGIPPITLAEARAGGGNPFDYACTKLLEAVNVKPMYDYIFIDEGQDFPTSFVRLCMRLTEKQRVVVAYDDLQTIFQTTTPDLKDLGELTEDTVLYKCYRNPREILVCAHAVGFGLYSDRIVQMLENNEQWEDIGYKVVSGGFVAGSETVIERPLENSLTVISGLQKPQEIVQSLVCSSLDEEVDKVVLNITNDLADGLRPDDILVIVVDDRNARTYLKSVSTKLVNCGISVNNLHDDSYGIRDFHREGHVTLSTVHKAKGNESFMVYVLGVDALYRGYASVRERNVLFTAMTRAKGWVRMSGIGEPAEFFKKEIDTALQNFPFLRFKFPSQAELKVIKRDLAEGAIRKLRAERKLDEVLNELSPEEIRRLLEQKAIKKENK